MSKSTIYTINLYPLQFKSKTRIESKTSPYTPNSQPYSWEVCLAWLREIVALRPQCFSISSRITAVSRICWAWSDHPNDFPIIVYNPRPRLPPSENPPTSQHFPLVIIVYSSIIPTFPSNLLSDSTPLTTPNVEPVVLPCLKTFILSGDRLFRKERVTCVADSNLILNLLMFLVAISGSCSYH